MAGKKKTGQSPEVRVCVTAIATSRRPHGSCVFL